LTEAAGETFVSAWTLRPEHENGGIVVLKKVKNLARSICDTAS
jgi:hypothetical protein